MKKRRPRRIKSKVFNYQLANRRRHSGSSRWIHGLIVLVLIAVATGIAYVWEHNRLFQMGNTVTKLQNEIVDVRAERIKLDAEVGRLKEPGRILAEVERRRLGLRPARPEQVIRIREPEPLGLADDEDAPRQPMGQKLWDAIVLGKR